MTTTRKVNLVLIIKAASLRGPIKIKMSQRTNRVERDMYPGEIGYAGV